MKHRSGFIVILLGLLEYSLSTSIRGVSQLETLDKNEASHVTWNICPHGWIHATREREEFEQTEPGEKCLFFSTEALSWFEAQRTCRESNSFLVSLDAFISVGDKSFLDSLEERYAFSIWTGLHEEEERLLWDDPANGEVRNLAGYDGSPVESKGGWSWNSSSFFNKNSTCGLLQLNSESPSSHERNRRQLDLVKLSVGSDVNTSPEEDITTNHNREKREKKLEPATNIFYDQDMAKQEDKAAGNTSTQKTEEARTSSGKPDNTTVDPVSSDDDEFQNELKKRSVQPEITTTQSSSPSTTANDISNVQTTPFTFLQTSESQFDSVFSSVENSTNTSGFTELYSIKHDDTTIAIESDLKSKIDDIEDAFNIFSKNSSTFIDKVQNFLSKESKPPSLSAMVNERKVESFGDGIENVTLRSNYNSSMEHSNTSTTIRVPVSSKSANLPVRLSLAEQNSFQALAVLPKSVTDSSGFVATREQVQVGRLGEKNESTYDTTTDSVTPPVEVTANSTDNTGIVTPPVDITANSTDNTGIVTTLVDITANSTDNTGIVTPPVDITVNPTDNTGIVTPPVDITVNSTVNTGSVTSPVDITVNSTDNTGIVTPLVEVTVNSTDNTGIVTPPVDITVNSTDNTGSVTPPVDITVNSTDNTESVTPLVDITASSTDNTGILTPPVDITANSTDNTGIVTTLVDITASSTDNTGIVTTLVEVTANSTDNTGIVTPPVDITANSTDNTGIVTTLVEVTANSTDNTGIVTPPVDITANSTDNTGSVTPLVDITASSTDNTGSVTPPVDITANSRGDTEITSITEYGVSDTANTTDHVFSYSDFSQQTSKHGPTVNQAKDYQLVTVGQTTRVEMKSQPLLENANKDIPHSPLPPTFTTEKQGNEKSYKIVINADTEVTPGSTTFSNPTLRQNGMNTIQADRSHLFHTGRKAKMSLRNCQQKNRFVCASKSIGGLRAVGHCERGWLGHSLLPYCYKPVGTPATHPVAWRQCLQEGASIISVENTFYENITELLIWTMRHLHGFPSGSVWVNGTVTNNKQSYRICDAIRDGKLEQQPCTNSLPFICQKSSKTEGQITMEGDRSSVHLMKDDIVVENMTSATPQPLWCPVQTTSHDDLVIWYKDGLPIPPESGNQNPWASTISRSPGILHLTTDILRRLGYSKRFRQPAMLQGFYWCKVWRPHPLTSLSSYKIFVRFTDVITLQGFVKSTGISSETETFFNKMRNMNSLPGIISRDMEKINEEALRDVKDRQPYLQDIMSTVTHVDAGTSETEILTYLCLSLNNLPLPVKGLLVEEYLKSVHLQLLASQEYLQRWNVTLSLDKALRFTVTEMCSEAKLLDKSTGYEATFPSTPVNHLAMSKEFCDGDFVGYAICSGDLRTGSSWGHREIDHSCNSTDQTPGHVTRGKPEPSKSLDRVQVEEKSSSLPQKPKPDLLVLDEVHIEPENVADVTNRLERILTSTDQLTEVDIEAVAGVISRITVVPVLPIDVGKNLLQIVSRVLDSPLEVLRRAQEQSNATTRILRDLDHFAGKMDFAQTPHVRYVTPNIAMELWNLGKTRETVIGFGATTALNDTSLLSESRILTIKNRTWAELHLENFDVAIELPDQVVMDPSAETLGMRLSMTIFRKPGLFLSSEHVETSVPPSTHVNSAVISATVDGRKIKNLEQKVKLVFKPEKMSDRGVTSCVFWDFGKSAGGGWSSYGCTFNGTSRGRHICLCDHLTNFAVLLDFYGDSKSFGEKDNNALSMITIVGVTLSMLSLASTIFTFIIFKKLRKGRAQQTLFNLSLALLCSQAILLIGLKQTTHYGVCLVVAVLLHYFILASFMWMMVEAVLQYLIFVKILGTYISRYTLKTMLSAWGVPVIPVVTVLCIDYRQYRGRRDYCWMELEAFYYAFALPVGVIMLFNLVLFSVIMSSLMRRPMEGLRNSKNKHPVAETNIKAAFTIFILLGLTWIFGYLAIEDARLPFQYLFTTLNSLQGFFIFVLLVARRRQVREQWKLLCCRLMSPISRKEKVSATHSSSLSSSFSGSSLPTSRKSFSTRSYVRAKKPSQLS